MTVTVTMTWRSPNAPAIHRHVENPIGIGKSATHDAHDGDDDELQRFSKWVGQLICIITPADYHGAHESFYLPPWQRRASRWNSSGRAWGCLCVEGKYGGCNTRADRITEKTLLKGLLYKGVTRYGFPAFRPRSLAGHLGLVGREPRPITLGRIIGAGLILLGVALVLWFR
jgi:hypothetical protein